MTRLTPESRQKLYLILTFTSLILLFYNVWLVKPIIVGSEDTLGMASAMLTPYYWIGLALILLSSIFVLLDRKTEKDAIYIVMLIALSLYLLGILQIVQENPSGLWSYYLFPVSKNLLVTHHIDFSAPSDPLLYYSWPARHFIDAAIFGITDISPIALLRYGNLIWILFFPFIIYSIGKRLNLPPNRCFLLSFLAISSWLGGISGGSYYRIHLFATLLFLLIFMLLLTPKRTVAEPVALILMFSALVISHGLTGLAIITGLILLSIYRRDIGYVALFLVVFGAWYIYQATGGLQEGIKAFSNMFQEVSQFLQVERYQEVASVSRLVTRYVDLFFLVSYAALMIGSAVWLLLRKVTGERRKQVISFFCWTIGVGLLVFWGHGEAVLRTYVYCTVSAVCIVVLTFSSRKLLIPLMCLFIALSPLLNHISGSSPSEAGQVLSSELKGAEFLAVKLNTRETFFYGYSRGIFMFYDVYYIGYDSPEIPKPPSKADISILDKLSFVVLSKQATEYAGKFGYAKGQYYPYDDWPLTEAGKKADLVYDNGYFMVYANHLGR